MANWNGSTRKETLPRNWNVLRKIVLKRDPICCTCHNAPSTDCDHVNDRNDHRLSNLQGLCKRCHDEKTIRDRESQRPSRKRPRENHPGII